MTGMNRHWVLAAHPAGMPDERCWELRESPIADPDRGELLVRTIWLSVDPYMRSRISRASNYAKGVSVGEVMAGGGVGEVLRSEHPDFAPGDIVESFAFGWRDHPVLPGAEARKVDPGLGPIRSALGHLGLPGLTAYLALDEIGQPKAGETVVISAAAGAVGQIAGQIARIRGCRAVAIASSDAKLAWCREIGFHAGVNYRTAKDLTQAVSAACPAGVDVFLDNTAGPIHDAVMANLAAHARVIVCGTVALADRFDAPDIGLRHLRQILVRRARIEGFLLFDHTARYEEARQQLAEWARSGQLRHREDIAEGIESMPGAFMRLLRSENFGKQLVRVSEEP